MKKILIFAAALMSIAPMACKAQKPQYEYKGDNASGVNSPGGRPALVVQTGAERFSAYLPLLKGKRVAVLVNQTSAVGAELLPDALLRQGVKVVTIFSPEHGFRGNADAGAHVKSGVDTRTGLTVISLYGDNKKPKPEQLKDIDVVIYDLQDVGVRFYTYISSLEYLLEACGEQQKEVIVLDRPNPLGNIVDGPVLQSKFRSFVGMQSIPIIYGMTPGEYAKMLIGEGWVKAKNVRLTVIPCANYTHKTLYRLPVAPSPNLKNMAAIYLYPSLCLFEGTQVSVGRGTDAPFQQYGHPALKNYTYSFVPKSVEGASNPPLKGQTCYGELLASDANSAYRLTESGFQLKWLLKAYQNYPDKANFFNSNNFFSKLAGTDQLQEQIKKGMSEEAIRKSWQADLDKFRSIRAKYLLYES
ncbi:exo-beta-N-acetylmuramidase NamZ family protein [Edaphocola flava]|uniref:exo-beta-N-acetylmuramidase NamZ family protein n=1 Tax=Edaphocola flava TaxID=2499629 RepID=UPI00100B9764|nr:DUF1343 domain-containing protein [Edaphocola flava]